MEKITDLILLGAVSGLFCLFWTKIIHPDMILGFIGRWFDKMTERHIIRTNKESLLIKLFTCSACLNVWVFAILAVFYVLNYDPCLSDAIIGIAGGVGAGNFLTEVISHLRANDL